MSFLFIFSFIYIIHAEVCNEFYNWTSSTCGSVGDQCCYGGICNATEPLQMKCACSQADSLSQCMTCGGENQPCCESEQITIDTKTSSSMDGTYHWELSANGYIQNDAEFYILCCPETGNKWSFMLGEHCATDAVVMSFLVEGCEREKLFLPGWKNCASNQECQTNKTDVLVSQESVCSDGRSCRNGICQSCGDLDQVCCPPHLSELFDLNEEETCNGGNCVEYGFDSSPNNFFDWKCLTDVGVTENVMCNSDDCYISYDNKCTYNSSHKVYMPTRKEDHFSICCSVGASPDANVPLFSTPFHCGSGYMDSELICVVYNDSNVNSEFVPRCELKQDNCGSKIGDSCCTKSVVGKNFNTTTNYCQHPNLICNSDMKCQCADGLESCITSQAPSVSPSKFPSIAPHITATSTINTPVTETQIQTLTETLTSNSETTTAPEIQTTETPSDLSTTTEKSSKTTTAPIETTSDIIPTSTESTLLTTSTETPPVPETTNTPTEVSSSTTLPTAVSTMTTLTTKIITTTLQPSRSPSSAPTIGPHFANITIDLSLSSYGGMCFCESDIREFPVACLTNSCTHYACIHGKKITKGPFFIEGKWSHQKVDCEPSMQHQDSEGGDNHHHNGGIIGGLIMAFIIICAGCWYYFVYRKQNPVSAPEFDFLPNEATKMEIVQGMEGYELEHNDYYSPDIAPVMPNRINKIVNSLFRHAGSGLAQPLILQNNYLSSSSPSSNLNIANENEILEKSISRDDVPMNLTKINNNVIYTNQHNQLKNNNNNNSRTSFTKKIFSKNKKNLYIDMDIQEPFKSSISNKRDPSIQETSIDIPLGNTNMKEKNIDIKIPYANELNEWSVVCNITRSLQEVEKNKLHFDQKDEEEDEDGIEPQYPQKSSKNDSIKMMHMGTQLDNLQKNKKRDPSVSTTSTTSGEKYGTLISGLDNLRKSHEKGILSDLEFQLAKEKLLLEN